MYLFSRSLQEKVFCPNSGINQEREWHGDQYRKGINEITKKANHTMTGAQASLDNIVQTGKRRWMAQGGLSKIDHKGQTFWEKNTDSL